MNVCAQTARFGSGAELQNLYERRYVIFDCADSQFWAPVNLLQTGGALFFFQVRRGRKTFCQSTVTNIGKFALIRETSPGGEQSSGRRKLRKNR